MYCSYIHIIDWCRNQKLFWFLLDIFFMTMIQTKINTVLTSYLVSVEKHRPERVPCLRPSNQHLPQLLCQPLPQSGGVFFVVEELCPDDVLIVYRTLYPVRQLGLYIRLSCSSFLLHSRGVPVFASYRLWMMLRVIFFPGIFTTSFHIFVQNQGKGERQLYFSPMANIWSVWARF